MRKTKVTLNNPISALHTFLNGLPIGEIKGSDENRRTVSKLLQDCWEMLNGSDDEKTFSTKIHRAESICWNPPIVSFELERHGATVGGSSRADLHHWSVDVEKGTANVKIGKYRQLSPKSPSMKTQPIAKEVANNIVNLLDDSTLEWDSDKSYVVIKISEIIPDNGATQTTIGRRKRFNKAMSSLNMEPLFDAALRKCRNPH